MFPLKPNARSEAPTAGTVLTASLLLYGGHGAVCINVTCASAVSQFTDRIKGVRILIFFMRSRFIIVGMTSGAIRPVGSPNHRLAVALVTAGTNHAEAMISGIGCRGMVEIYGRPVCGVVAFITLQAGHKMIGGFTRCGSAIVTGRATSRHQGMIHVSGCPSQVVVATIALS